MEDKIQNKILTISGSPASGKSTVIKHLIPIYEKKGYNVTLVSVGDMFREIANEKGLSIGEFNEYMKKMDDIDKLIDNKVKEYGKKINSQKRDNELYIFDSRLAWYNIPESFSIRLTVNDTIAGQRVFSDTKRGKEDKYETLEQAIISTKARKEHENERYMERYGVDLGNPNNYKLVIDTSYASIEEIAEIIITSEELYSNNFPFDRFPKFNDKSR